MSVTQGKTAIAGSKRLAWLAAAIAVVLASIAFGRDWQGANAIANDGDVTFSVTQSPAAPTIVAPGSTMTFTVAATVNLVNGYPSGLFFEFAYPTGLTFVNGVSSPPGISCADNTPVASTVRCIYGPVLQGALVPLTLTFTINGNVTTSGSQVMMRGGVSDGSPDTAAAAGGNDDSFASAGHVSVYGVSDSVGASPVFEGGSSSYTAVITNTLGAPTGSFNASISFTNASVSSVSCTAASGTDGTAAGNLTSTASCSGSALDAGPGTTLTIAVTLTALDSANGDDIVPSVTSTLGIQAGDFPSQAIGVNEVGLTASGSTLTLPGAFIHVCTGTVASDIANSAAAGAAQPGAPSLIGFVSGAQQLTVSDFQVTGPAPGSVSAASCASGQSGVDFSPTQAGAYTVTPRYNGGSSNSLTLNVTSASNPLPSTTSINPSSANAGSGAFTLTVNGAGFIDGVSTVKWNGSARTTTCSSAAVCTASINTGDVASTGTASVTVVNPTPGGGTSNAQTFTISNAPNPVPSIASVNPTSTVAGGAQFTLNVVGSNFVAGSQVKWNGSLRSTTYVDATHLNATITSGDIATPTSAAVSVFNPAPGGGDSATTVPFTVTSGASKLGFTSQPSNGVAGTSLSTQPVVSVLTSGGAPVTYDNTTVVTLQLVGSGTLTCTGGLSKTVASGVATFAGCSVDSAATGLALLANATSLTSATSSAFNITAAPPTSSTQLVVAAPASGVFVPRSRLTFSATTGTLAPTPTSATFVIKRKSDNKYWNNTTLAWESTAVENTATAGSTSGTWELAITGESRRLFVDTTVVVTAHATSGSTVYESAVSPEIAIR